MNLGWNRFLVIIYLAAVVIANLLVTKYGPKISVLNAFLFIGLDLTTRDQLHEAWNHKNLFWRMFNLIYWGSALTFLFNNASARISIASAVSFLVAGSIDFIAYHLLIKNHRFIKINGSNIFSAAADSIIFPTLAFGAFLPMISLANFLAKILGGFIWSLIIIKESP